MTTDTLHPLAAEYLQRHRAVPLDTSSPARAATRNCSPRSRGTSPRRSSRARPDAQALYGAREARRAGGKTSSRPKRRPPDEPPARRGTKEWAAVMLILLGGFILGVGWVAGLVLLWSSRAWTTREKVDRNVVMSYPAASPPVYSSG